jgi:hypothetical protein
MLHNVGRSHGVGWFHEPEVMEAETWNVVPEAPIHLENCGVYLIGQVKTPEAKAA